MRPFDAGFSLAVSGSAHHVDVEFVGVFFLQTDVDAVLGDEHFATFHTLGGTRLKHFQLFFSIANENSQGDGDRQSNHPRTGNAYSHGVFQDIGTQFHLHPFGQSAKQFFGFRRAQGHGYRLGTANGRHHLLVNQVENGLSVVVG